MGREFLGARQGVSRTVADKLKLLRLAKEYGNVARACKEMHFARSSYYRLRDLHKRLGEAGLEPTSRRGRPLLKNRVEPDIEKAVVTLTRKHLGWSQARVAYELSGKGISISSTGVRGVWQRNRNNLPPREPPYAPPRWRPAKAPQPKAAPQRVLCPNCHKGSGVRPFVCSHCRVGIPRHK